jgi:hypothetical protein
LEQTWANITGRLTNQSGNVYKAYTWQNKKDFAHEWARDGKSEAPERTRKLKFLGKLFKYAGIPFVGNEAKRNGRRYPNFVIQKDKFVQRLAVLKLILSNEHYMAISKIPPLASAFARVDKVIQDAIEVSQKAIASLEREAQDKLNEIMMLAVNEEEDVQQLDG